MSWKSRRREAGWLAAVVAEPAIAGQSALSAFLNGLHGCSPGPDRGHVHSELARASAQLPSISMNRTQQEKLKVVLDLLIELPERSAFVQLIEMETCSSEEKGIAPSMAAPREAINEHWTSSNSPTLLVSSRPCTPAQPLERWVGQMEWQ